MLKTTRLKALAATSLSLPSLAADGGDAPAGEGTNLALNLPEDKIAAYLEANDKTEYYMDESFPNASYGTAEGKGKAALVDGDLTGQMDWWGSYATHSFNLVLDFGDQRLMNKVELTDFTGGTQEQLAKKYTVYVGNSLTEVFGVTAMPVAVYTRGEEDADATMTLSFSPEIGQYIRVCIDEPGVGNQMRLNELAVYGADVDDVESTSTDPNVAVGFENKDYGIKVDILKLDGKDTFNDVRSMTVTPRDMTAEEKADLAEVYLLPFSKVYDIAFLDKDGKPVTDFGGRKFRWTFQIPKELIDTTSYLGIISQDGAEIVNADYVDDTLTFTDENDPPYTHYFVATGDPNANMGGGGYEPEEPIVPTGVGLPVSMMGLAAVSALTVLAIRKNRKGDK